ncbi:site-specific integrase [Xanthobacter sp. KR7-65]|uniref:site-specific integrase n=1 Tax=Xanthobacter sp. KR7-65 TaxID=3156612 RepID=UPI0032B38A20
MGKWIQRVPYLQRTRHGIFRYRRVVPPSLKAAAGKREILVSLRTKSVHLAEGRFIKAHAEAEAWLATLRASLSPSAPSSDLDLDGSWVPPTLKAEPAAKATNCGPTVSDALDLYLAEKRDEFAAYRGRALQVRLNEKRRVIGYLVASLGGDREVETLTRADARSFRDFLGRKGLSAGSVKKNIRIAGAILAVAIAERQIMMSNPFHRLAVKADVAAIDARLPLTSDEIETVLGLSVNNELQVILTLLVSTGARLGEIAGLIWGDICRSEQGGAYIEIRSNAVRRLKTAASTRSVPLLENSEMALQRLREGQAWPFKPEQPVFPRYGRSGGPDAASAALMKALRAVGINDPKKSVHSIRHSVKQALRDIGCPRDIRDAIQGHAAPGISEHYGTGHSLAVMRKWLSEAAPKLGHGAASGVPNPESSL